MLRTGGDIMAVIRTVSKVTHFNMDISEEELLAILVCIKYRREHILRPQPDPYKSELVQMAIQIEAALQHG